MKLLDWEGRDEELLASDNPFAKVVLAHLKTLGTRGDLRERKDWRLRIVQGAHECGFGEEDVRQVTLLVDWLMELPVELERDYLRELGEYEEGRQMPYTTISERSGMVRLLEALLREKFGEEGAALIPAIWELNNAEKFKDLGRLLVRADSLEEIRRACAAAGRRPSSTGKKGRRTSKAKE